jgi:hypothetical protein
MYESYLRTVVTSVVLWWITTILVALGLVWNPSWFRGLPELYGLKFETLIVSTIVFWTRALIIWMVPLHIPHEPRHLGILSGVSKLISELVVCSAQTVYLSCIKISTVSKWTELSFHWVMSPRCTIGCIQNAFWAYGTFITNRAPILDWY